MKKVKSEKLKIKNSGFTLVELLIVIALIAVLAAALVATLNPVEQINKARDARYKNDAAELLAAIERSYASTLNYPWMTGVYCGASACTISDAWAGDARNVAAGLCDATDSCENDDSGSTYGTLIDSGELKSSFGKKEQFVSAQTTPENLMHVVKEIGSEGGTYVCFIPKAGTNRDPVTNTGLRLKNIYDDGAYLTTIEDCASPAPTGTDWDVLNTACYICIPE